MKFDFKKYHYRSMNAANEQERAGINGELKELYASLSIDDQKIFNDELKIFMLSEYSNITSSYEGLKGNDENI